MKLVFRNLQAPGDLIVITALVRELHQQYPGRFTIDVESSQPHVWANNPYLIPLNKRDPDVKTIQMRYGPYLHDSDKSRLHFLTAFPQYFTKYMSQHLPGGIKLTQLRGDVHFTEEELNEPIIEGNYWVVIAGGKSDFTAKIWEHKRWQQVVDMLDSEVKFVQLGGGASIKRPRHIHQRLNNTVNLLGSTNFRQFMRIVLHAQGVCCHVTAGMHLAGALNKPCVVIAGGREAYTWEAYTRETWQLSTGEEAPPDFVEHKFLHTQGQLDCCRTGGCWKSHVGEAAIKKGVNVNCVDLVPANNGLKLPHCLDMITPEQVAEAIRSYGTPKPDTIVVHEDRLKGPELERQKEADAMASLPEGFDYTGKVTICTLLYGEYHELHKRVVTSIVTNTPKDQYKFIVGCNEACQETLDWLPSALEGTEHEIMIEPTNIYKYPFMRKMFAKLDTDWMVWFDDDSHTKNPQWLHKLVELLRRFHPSNHHCFGKKYFIHTKPGQLEWVQKASWYKGKPLQRRNAKERITFATGGFWAMSTEAIRRLDWPDPRINHNGGDVMLGEALNQNDLLVKNTLVPGVKISDHGRRGYSEIHPGVHA